MNTKYSSTLRLLLRLETPTLCLIVLCNFAFAQQAPSVTLKRSLNSQIREFDNNRQSLIPTLMQISAAYHLPMGIERVVDKALDTPIAVKRKIGTVAQLIDLSTRQIPGYSWKEEDGVVFIYGEDERASSSNLFNVVIPAFSMRNETINVGSSRLATALYLLKERPTGGFEGSYVGSLDLDGKTLTFETRHSTVREILNRMMALYRDGVWIATAHPSELSHLPTDGLWTIRPAVQNQTHSMQSLRRLLDKHSRQRK